MQTFRRVVGDLRSGSRALRALMLAEGDVSCLTNDQLRAVMRYGDHAQKRAARAEADKRVGAPRR